MNLIEGTGEKFDLKKYFDARSLCIEVTGKIANQVQIGMNESDGQALVREEFKKVGISKFWHPTKFRIGADTTKSFRELGDPNFKTEKNDIFFLDLGPVIEDHEADYGETFRIDKNGIVSKNHELCENAKQVWVETAKAWRDEKLSGVQLLEKANQFARERKCILNPKMAGHRLGDFPHTLFSKEALFSLDFRPSENLWVLEIHILNEVQDRGALFEDILV